MTAVLFGADRDEPQARQPSIHWTRFFKKNKVFSSDGWQAIACPARRPSCIRNAWSKATSEPGSQSLASQGN